ncbi:hypothetical protein [Calothrix sp. PCC 6303]|uniref:hypothetical protein n=1 Tax=Calothrix sp. PCC 6303 TaxID=1170562 RepID=UPI0002A01172|nr:hypothetical protein [Calothrix sp. PCC 6303]AFZ00870.1 hypothetical protein Cal6303_1834 [Calothrix sp. PCC 6303]
MTYRLTFPLQNPSEVVQPQNQPLYAWLAIASLILFSTVCIAGGIGGIFRPGFVVVSFVVGIFLYARYPIMYLGFTWWMWFLTSLLSRLIDVRTNFDESRFILVAPYLVTLITLYSVFKHLPRASREGGLPFILALSGVFYAFMVGLIKAPTYVTAARALLEWITPLSLSFYLFINWRNYPLYRKNILRVFLWGVIVTGAYGIFQYIVAPEWDKFWLISTKLTSMGEPAPLQIRVWSTMASPGPFAVMMMSGLLLIFNGGGALAMPAAGVGYLAFLLTMVRVMWGCWVVGLLGMITSIKPRLQMRLMITIIIMALCVVPLSTMEPFATAINTRLQSFTNLENDDSAQIRQKIYEEGLNNAITNVMGNGIGNTFIINKEGVLESIVVDSGILETFFTLGWLGAIPYVSGLLLLMVKVLQATESRFDTFMAASRAIGIACVTGIPIFSIMLGFSGIFLWAFLALALAGHNYYQRQAKNHY